MSLINKTYRAKVRYKTARYATLEIRAKDEQQAAALIERWVAGEVGILAAKEVAREPERDILEYLELEEI